MCKIQRLEVSGAVRPIYGSLRVKRLITDMVLLNISWKDRGFSYFEKTGLSLRVSVFSRRCKRVFWSAVALVLRRGVCGSLCDEGP
jgi:hypothetical protein